MEMVAEIAEYPRIVCLCGSTRFYGTFQEITLQETLAGRIVLSIGCDTKSDQGLRLSEGDKERLDELHRRKIDFADEIFVINPGCYVGSSTAGEILYAWALRKPIRWLEMPPFSAHRYDGREDNYPFCEYSGCLGLARWWCNDGGVGWFYCDQHAFLFGSPVSW